jgi:hypothetical protein
MRMTFLGRICRRNKNSERSSTVEKPVDAMRFLVRGVKAFHNHGGMSAVEDGTLIHRGWEREVLSVEDFPEEEETASEEGGGRQGSLPT